MTTKIGFSLGGGGGKRKDLGIQGKKAEAEKREMLTNISDGKIISEGGGGEKAPLVIPRMENTFQVGVGRQRGVPSYVPDLDDNVDGSTDKFEVAQDVAVQENVQYGLRVREKAGGGGGGPKVIQGESFLEKAMAAKDVMSQRDQDTQQFKEDVEALPEEASLEAYEAMPIEAFGEAMLRGMGWEKGKPVGRNAKEEVIAIEYVKRPTRLGLGAEPAPDIQKERKYIKPGESRGDQKRDLVVAKDADGRQRHVRRVDEELVEREKKGAHPGKVMRVMEGRHEGLMCTVLSVEDPGEGRSKRATVRLEPSKEKVVVRARELGERWDKPEELPPPSSKGERRDRERDSSKKRPRDEDGDGGRPAPPARPWLRAYIKVRVVDKRMDRGRLYLKKGVVVDVTTPTSCELQMEDGGRIVSGVQQGALETVIPKRTGGRIIALSGPRRGEKGKLLTRDKERELASVQFLSDGATEMLPLDVIAEFVGQAEDDE